MKKLNIQNILLSAQSLTVLKNITKTDIFQLTYKAIESYKKDVCDFCCAYTELCKSVFENGPISNQFYNELVYDDNVFARNSIKNYFDDIPHYIVEAVDFDLKTIGTLSDIRAKKLINYAQEVFREDSDFLKYLPEYPNNSNTVVSNSKILYELYLENGYGYFARGKAFSVKNGKAIYMKHTDEIKLSDLKGYERQKNTIIANTTAFLEGMQCNNILLYGDKGTGKSSTVKAIVNEYADKGLKIIEIKLNEIEDFPKICEEVTGSPFKFILFLDDLSFNQEDKNFAALKAFIEGGISGKPNNILIYATSNRRHLIREGFSDRALSDDIHLRDTLETITSLSDRFGIEITFSVPGKDEYLDIVEKLAAEFELDMDSDELHMLAERFALRRNGRSPRTARQFIYQQNMLINGKGC